MMNPENTKKLFEKYPMMSEETEEKMEDKRLRLFNLQYTWYEGEHESTILATTKEKEEMKKDLKDVANSIEIDEKKEKAAIYKSDAYQRIIKTLKQKGYIECSFFLDPDYYVDEIGIVRKTKFLKYGIIHHKEKVEWKRLR